MEAAGAEPAGGPEARNGARDGASTSTSPAIARTATEVQWIDLGWRTALGGTLALVGVVLLFRLVQDARNALTWIVLGTLFALALEPVVRAVERVLRRRWAAVAVVSVIGFVAAATFVIVLVPIAAREAGKFADDAPKLVERIGDIPIVGQRLVDADVPDKIETWVSDLPRRLGTDDTPLEGLFRSALSGLTAAIATTAMVVAVLLDGRRIRRGALRLVPASRQGPADRALEILYQTVGRYFAGSLLVAGLAGSGILIVGLLAGVPLAPVAAVWVMVTNLIPQIGGFLGGSVFVLLGATQGPTTLLICLAWFLGYQQFENNVLQPTIVGDAVDLSPPVTMVAALMGASAFGVPGALVAIPLLGTTKAVLIELGVVRPRREAEGERAGHSPGRLKRLLGRGRGS
jgi:predicted PurR-regulated permease PerM